MPRSPMVSGSLIALILASITGASDQPGTVDAGVIHVGRGAAGVNIGMPTAQVRENLGEPARFGGFGELRYRHEGVGMFQVNHGCGGKTNLITVQFPRSKDWRLGNGIKVFRPLAIRKMLRVYGRRRLFKINDEGQKSYQINTRVGRRTNVTVFTVDRFNPYKGRVRFVEIFAPTFSYEPRCSRKHLRSF